MSNSKWIQNHFSSTGTIIWFLSFYYVILYLLICACLPCLAFLYEAQLVPVLWCMIFLRYSLFVLFLETRYLCVDWLPRNSHCRPVWPLTHRDPPASVSRVLGLKACSIIPRLWNNFLNSRWKKRIAVWLKGWSDLSYTPVIHLTVLKPFTWV